MESYQGYFVEQDKFVSTTPVRIPLRRRTIVTILDEPVDDNDVTENVDVNESEQDKKAANTSETVVSVSVSEEVARKLRSLELINALLDESSDEEVPDFERANLHREVDL